MMPTLLVVLIIAFFLSKMVPGDAAESLLILQAVNLDQNNSESLYIKNYVDLGLQKPLFYASIRPNFYPENIHLITSKSERNEVKTWLKQQVSYPTIIRYMDAKKTMLLLPIPNNLDSIAHENYLKFRKKLSFASELEEIQEIYDADILKNHIPNSVATTLKSSIEAMSSSKNTFFYPVFQWHGMDNQFHKWISNLLSGDFGTSFKDGRRVEDKIVYSFKWTIVLVLLNLLFSTIIAVPMGIYTGYHTSSLLDKVMDTIWLCFYSIPTFWLASILIIYFTSDRYGSYLDIFPIPGTWFIPDGQAFFASLYTYSSQLILPIICLVCNDLAVMSRLVRNNVIEQKSKYYILVAKSKGLSAIKILRNHILPNILLPLVTMIGGRIPAGIAGSLVVEVIFNIPGMGRLMYDSIYNADWNVVYGLLLCVSFITIVFITCTDMLYLYLNPKIQR